MGGLIFGVLGRERLLDLLRRNPTANLELLRSLTWRLREATAREHRLAFLDVRQRLCRLFTVRAMEEGIREEDGRFRIRKLTHRDLAMRIGASRESVTKALKALAGERIVVPDGESLLVSPSVGEGITGE